MTHYELFLFVSVTAFQVALCVLVYSRQLQKRLPFFAIYADTILFWSFTFSLISGYFGFRAAITYYAYWGAMAASTLARTAAVAELCRGELRGYQGIWAMAWRGFTFLAVVFVVHAAVDAWDQPNRLAIYGLTIERDIEISSIVILLTMLLIRRYYGITFEPLRARIAGGILIFCLIEFVNNTILRDTFAGPLASWFHTAFQSTWSVIGPQVDRVSELWNTIQTIASIVSIGIWCYALRKPLPAPAQQPQLLPVEVYRSLSPAVNLRLRAFNDRLEEMLKS